MAICAETCPQCGGAIASGYGNQATCQYCGSSLVRLSPPPGPGPAGADPMDAHDPAAAVAGAWGVRMKRAACMDPKSGLIAFQSLIPADWEFTGDIWWRDSATMPAIPVFRAWNPNGSEQIEWLPTIPNMWSKNILTEALGKWRIKAFAFKQDGIEQRVPLTPIETLRSLVIPRYRGQIEGQEQTRRSPWSGRGNLLAGLIGQETFEQRVQTLRRFLPGLDSAKKLLAKATAPRYKPYDVVVRVVAEEPLPKLAEALRGGLEVGGPMTSDGARIRVAYTLDGKPLEEDLFCVVSQVVTRTGSRLSAQENIFWTAEALYAFRASAGHLDAVGQACMASVKSLQVNPQWLQACQAESRRILNERAMMARAMAQMAASQRQALQRLGDVSKSISETGDMIMDGYMARSASYDRMGDMASEAIRGVDSYIDPTCDFSPQLPGGYDHAWGNGLGEYIVSNDHLYDPNQHSNMNWQQLQRRF
ncbi:MAG: hypothetical protein QM570_02635 [Planctomycetota bacterium]|nr:hypothetical protein [Planctomycetota bacterium]